MTPVRIPSLGLDDQTLRIGVWFCREGRHVQEGQRLLEIIAGEAVIDLPAPADGILRKLVAEEETVAVGQVVAEINT